MNEERSRVWKRVIGVAAVLALIIVPFLLSRDEPSGPRTPAPELDVAQLAFAADARQPRIDAPPAVLTQGGRGWLHAELLGAGSLAMLEITGEGIEAGRVLARADFEVGTAVLPFEVPRGDALSVYVVLTAEPLDDEALLEIGAKLGERGPWLRPALLRELRADGVPRPVARVYGASALLE